MTPIITSSTPNYYIEHDDFFKYIREFLREESSHIYCREYINNYDIFELSSGSDSDSESNSNEYY